MHWFRIAIKSCPFNYFGKGFRTFSIALSVTLIWYAIVQMWHSSTQLQFTPWTIQNLSVIPVLWLTTLFNWNFQIPSIDPEKQVHSAWLILLLPIGWLILGKWCWLVVVIWAIFHFWRTVFSLCQEVHHSRVNFNNSGYNRMLCHILLGNYIECCTLNWINSSYIWIWIEKYATWITSLHMDYIHWSIDWTHHYWSQLVLNTG